MNTRTMGERLKYCREHVNESLEAVGELVGVHKTTVMRWENGETKRISLDVIETLASHFGVSSAWLAGKDVPKKQAKFEGYPDNIIPLPKTKAVPLLGTIACGKPILAVENVSCYVRIDEEVKVDFALECKGDSMINARIFDGDVVYIREQPDVENGEIAAVLIGEEATLKKVYKYPSKIVLCPENPLYDDIVYSEEKMNEIRILGKAVAFLSMVRHRKDV